MTAQAWQVLIELEQPAKAESIVGSIGGIAELVRTLALSNTVVEQIQREVSSALQRVAERCAQQLVRLTVSAKMVEASSTARRSSWGFFLVEKPATEVEPHRIEVFLYQDTGSGFSR
jgi:hypothetical protein